MLPPSKTDSYTNNRILKIAIIISVLICIGLLISELSITDLATHTNKLYNRQPSHTQSSNNTQYHELQTQVLQLQSELQRLHELDRSHKELLESAKQLLIDSNKQYDNTINTLKLQYDELNKQVVQHNDYIRNTPSSDNTQRIIDISNKLSVHNDLLIEKSYPYFFNALFVVSLRAGRWDKFVPQFNDWPELYDIMYHLESTNGADINITDWQLQGKLTPEFHTLSREIVQGQYIRQMARGELGCAESHIRAWERCVALNLKYCWIAEDDAVINRSLHESILKSIPQELDKLNLLDTFDVLWLGWTWGGWKRIDGTDNFVIPDNIDFIVTHSYIISQSGAQKLLLNKYPIKMPVDCYMAQQTHYKGNNLLNGLLYKPELVHTFKDTWSDTQGIQ